jgi:Cys-tRNA(Pro)/Cys-tRNA(Cys) deacylase
MARKQASQGTPATAALAAAGVPFVAHPYSHDPAAASYGLEAAEVLGVDPARVFKTLMVDVDGRLAVGVVPVSGNLDLKAMAAALGGKKATMADPAAAERPTGYVLGGISPLGQRQPSPTVVDDSALGLDTILVSGGRRGLDIELSPAELIRLTGAHTARIGTGKTNREQGPRDPAGPDSGGAQSAAPARRRPAVPSAPDPRSIPWCAGRGRTSRR